MPFLPPNQQRQSTEGKKGEKLLVKQISSYRPIEARSERQTVVSYGTLS